MRSARLFVVAVSICLLLVLAFGTITQIAAVRDPNEWAVTIGYPLGAGGMPVFVNDIPYCITPDTNTLSTIQSEAASIQPKVNSASQLSITVTGDIFEGTCDDPGALVGPIEGTLTAQFPETFPGPFTSLLVFDVGPGLMNYHSEAKLTGDLQYGEPGNLCALKNVVSEYAFVRGTGLGGISLNVDLELLRLEPESGECSVMNDLVWLPTFVFRVFSLTVGGLVIPANTLALVAPWLAVIGVVGCIGTAVVVTKKRR